MNAETVCRDYSMMPKSQLSPDHSQGLGDKPG